MSNDDGGAAFPLNSEYGAKFDSSEGMTLRDYFAAKAMASCLATTDMMGLFHSEAVKEDMTDAEAVASFAYGMADAMLAERNKK